MILELQKFVEERFSGVFKDFGRLGAAACVVTMLGHFVTRVFVMLLGYAYPAFECFKTVEKNRADIEQLRFWCQYWVIVAVVTIFERIGDIFVSWLPLYGEAKLAFFIYLWHPKTKGTSYVYGTFLQPYIAKHETEIDRQLLELRTGAWDIALLYWKHFASQGQLRFYEFLQFLAKQSRKSQNGDERQPNEPSAPTSNADVYHPSNSTIFHRRHDTQNQPSTPKWQPPPPPPPTVKCAVKSQTMKPEHVYQAMPDATATAVEHSNIPESTKEIDSADYKIENSSLDETLRAARVKLRRAQKPE